MRKVYDFHLRETLETIKTAKTLQKPEFDSFSPFQQNSKKTIQKFSGVFRKAPGAILEAPGTLPDQILIGFCDTFLLVKAGSCRGLSGSAGMLPGSAPNLSNPLCGVPLGYGDLAQRFK